MAGTRLAVHATFVIELVALVLSALLYASRREHDPSASAEPFLPDRSGWTILVEDVAPAPAPGEEAFDGIVGRMGDVASRAAAGVEAVAAGFEALAGIEPAKPRVPRPRTERSSAFVREVRRKIEAYPTATIEDDSGEEALRSAIVPPMRVTLVAPQVASSAARESLARALERGFRSRSKRAPTPEIVVGATDRSDLASDVASCDEFEPPVPLGRGGARRARHPEIIVLMGCGSGSVELHGRTDVVVVKTVLKVEERDDLERHLEDHASNAVSDVFFPPITNHGDKMSSLSIELIDENPQSHVTGGDGNVSAKTRFDLIGKALSSSARTTMGPLLEDVAFLNGAETEGNNYEPSMSRGIDMQTMDAIDVEVRSTAYLRLPKQMIDHESTEDENNSVKYVSSDRLASWMNAHLQRYGSADVGWTLFVPSQANAPLMIRDDQTDETGISVGFESPTLEGKKTGDGRSNGMSITNLPSLGANEVDVNHVQRRFEGDISQSLTHLAGYIRAKYGLPASQSTPASVKYVGEMRPNLSFWELESIARSHFSSSLDLALRETDSLMATLHHHGGTLAFPPEVAHKLNNATHLLRQSMSLVDEGFPVVYATASLHGSLRYLESVQSDHRFMELPYFAPDHYLAVFSPLVLPLMLPMIAGLIREVKRFRKLRKKVGQPS
ncbi:hypothetical protein ACHAWF_003354 [Thalassiosira exigua]